MLPDSGTHRFDRSLVFALTSILLWSLLAVGAKSLAHIPPFLLLSLALGVGALPSIHRAREWLRSPGIVVFGTAGIFGYHLFLFTAFRRAPAIEANLINYLWPILIVFFSPIFLRGYSIGVRAILGGVLSFVGVSLLVSGGTFSLQWEYIDGYLLALSAAVTWALYSVLTKRLPPFSTAMVGGFCLVSSILAGVCHLLFEQTPAISTQDGLLMMALGIGPLGIAFYAWDAAIKRGDPRKIGVLSYLTPLLSTFWLAISDGGQAITWITGASLILILSGSVLSASERSKLE